MFSEYFRRIYEAGRTGRVCLANERRVGCELVGYAHGRPETEWCIQTTTTFDEFLARQDHGDNEAVRLLSPLRLRYFSPTELLRLFAFLPQKDGPEQDAKFTWPEDVSTKTKYKLIGNSVNVRVVRELINYLYE